MVEQGKASCVAVGEGNEISVRQGDPAAGRLCGRQGAVGAQEGLYHRKGRSKARGAQDAARRLRGAGLAQEAEVGESTRCLQRPALLILFRAIHASPTSTGQPRTTHESFLTSNPFFCHFDFFLPLSSPLFSSSCLSRTRRQNQMVKHGSACRGWRELCLRVRP